MHSVPQRTPSCAAPERWWKPKPLSATGGSTPGQSTTTGGSGSSAAYHPASATGNLLRTPHCGGIGFLPSSLWSPLRQVLACPSPATTADEVNHEPGSPKSLRATLSRPRCALGRPATRGRRRWRLNAALFAADFVDELHVTVCPLLMGGRTPPSIADGGAPKNSRTQNVPSHAHAPAWQGTLHHLPARP